MIGSIIKGLKNAADQDWHLILDAIEEVKRYIHNEGANRKLCARYQGDSGPTPSHAECLELLDGLRDWCIRYKLFELASSLQAFRYPVLGSSGTPVTSGLALPSAVMPRDDSWRQAALRIDEALSALKTFVLGKDPDLELPWHGPLWDSLGKYEKALLKFMYARKQAPIGEITRAVWNEEDSKITDNQIHSTKSKANRFLLKMRYPKHLTKRPGENVIRWVD
jgi:hypothetical protein